MQIVIFPDKSLRNACKKVEDFNDPRLRPFADSLTSFIERNRDAVGLSAPQVRSCLRIFAFKDDDRTILAINPEITRSKGSDSRLEGCLSLPGVFKRVERSIRIKVLFQDLTGTFKAIKLNGLAARVFQHELDHLNGKLIIDY